MVSKQRRGTTMVLFWMLSERTEHCHRGPYFLVLPLGSQQPRLSQGRDLHQAIEICLYPLVLRTLLEHKACLEGELSARPLTCIRSGISNKVPAFPSEEISSVYLPNSNLSLETVGKRPMSHEPSLGHTACSVSALPTAQSGDEGCWWSLMPLLWTYGSSAPEPCLTVIFLKCNPLRC